MKKVFSVLEGIGVYLAFLLLPGILLLAVQLLAPGAAEGAGGAGSPLSNS